MKTRLLLPIVLLAVGCPASSGPASTKTCSDQFDTLAEKVAFLEQYVRFRRSYRQLDFCINYRNSSGDLLPAPTEWDIRIVAQVPPSQLTLWTAGLEPISAPDASWIARVPTAIDHSGVSLWFKKGHVVAGVDKETGVVVYWNLAI